MNAGAEHIRLPGASLRYWPAALAADEADAALLRLREELDWQQREILMFGRRCPQPRLVAWYGEPEARYRYSGLQLEPLPWPPGLVELRQRVESLCGLSFNGVLANLYRDGRDHMGWHRDNERELGPDPVLASVSLGAERDFQLRPLRGEPRSIHRLRLGHGSLLLMAGATQAHYQHRLPRRPGLQQARINLTFRRILPPD